MSYLFDAQSSNQVSSVQSCVVLHDGRREFREPFPGEMILYYYPLSFYSEIVLFSFFHKNIPFTGQLIDIHKGEQFSEEFLKLNSRGEVPVLCCGITNTKISDSIQIIDHLDSVFNNEAGIPKLHPDDPAQNYRCGEFVRKLHLLKLEALTFGSVQFSDLHIEPEGAFKSEGNREKMREYIKRRRAIYRTEAMRNPEFEQSINNKLRDIEHDWHFMEVRDDYERLLISFERELDECEAELATHPKKHTRRRSSKVGTEDDNEEWWLVSEDFSVADICLGILLHRVTEIGFYKRLIKPRPHLRAYLERLKNLDSYKRATGESSRLSFGSRTYLWWLVLIPLGTIVVFGLWGLIQGPPEAKTEFTTIPIKFTQTKVK